MIRSGGPEPFLLAPIPVPRVWGGERLLSELHPDLSPPIASDGRRLPVGETWEVSDVDDDPAFHSRITSGAHAGRSLRAVLREDPLGILGPAGVAIGPDGAPQLPLLFKYIDAREDLSVQVHPSDELLVRLGRQGRGKSEAWVVLDAQAGARMFVGYEPGWDLERFLRAAREGCGEEGLRRVPVQSGDIIEIPPGLVHSIGGGVLLAEIQQSSDITWRIHDWARKGLDGRPRALHLLEASQAVPPDPLPPCPLPSPPIGPFWTRAIDGAHFRLDVRRESGGSEAGDLPVRTAPIIRRNDRFGILALLDGADGALHSEHVLPLALGSVVFVPAGVRAELCIEVRGALWALWIEPGGPGRD